MLKAKQRRGSGLPQVKPPRAMVSNTSSTNMDIDETERRNSHFRAQPIRTQASTGGSSCRAGGGLCEAETVATVPSSSPNLFFSLSFPPEEPMPEWQEELPPAEWYN